MDERVTAQAAAGEGLFQPAHEFRAHQPINAATAKGAALRSLRGVTNMLVQNGGIEIHSIFGGMR